MYQSMLGAICHMVEACRSILGFIKSDLPVSDSCFLVLLELPLLIGGSRTMQDLANNWGLHRCRMLSQNFANEVVLSQLLRFCCEGNSKWRCRQTNCRMPAWWPAPCALPKEGYLPQLWAHVLSNENENHPEWLCVARSHNLQFVISRNTRKAEVFSALAIPMCTRELVC